MSRMISRQRATSTDGIASVSVTGFKSIGAEQTIDILPFTILAGANSSGKSSIMQPLLLLKQTLEATYDPGALLLNGPNVRFTSAEQLLSRRLIDFRVGINADTPDSIVLYFAKRPGENLDIQQISLGKQVISRIYRGMTESEMQ